MKIVATVTDIAEAAAFAARHSPRLPAIPALAGLVVEAGADGLMTFTGYDVEGGSTMSVPAQVDEPGLALLPGRPLAEILRTLPAGEARLQTDAATVRISTDDIEFVLPILDADDRARFPQLPPPAGRIAGAALKPALVRVASVTGRDVVPPVLTAVRLDVSGDELALAATDKYRIALHRLPWSGPSDPARALVPAHQLAAVAAVLDPAREWSLGIDPTNLVLRDGVRTCLVRLLDGAYPPVESVVPEAFAACAEIDRVALLQAIRRVCLAGDERARGAVTLRSVAADAMQLCGGQGTSTGRQRLPCTRAGSDIEAAFTASYLSDALDSLPGSRAVIRLNPGIGKVLVTDPGLPGYQHVLMSRRLPA